MEDIPPSYNNINPGVLDLLPPYLSTVSLVNLCLVSRAYYDIFIPHLWGSPASHFVEVANESSRTTNGINFANLQVSGSQNDMVYVALTRFKRTLRKARLSTRQLCHTLHLPPALSEIYGGPNSTWLREVLDWLPALQSLCVSGLPFFDHESLVAVDQSRALSITNPNDSNFRHYPVKLLLAAKEPNVTWAGLSLLIPHLPDLVYLDLSYTTPARNVTVLRSLDALRHLQVLKLRGLGLRDSELEVLASTIRLRVRLLDISENQLSDASLQSLMQSCVWLPSTAESMPSNRYSRHRFESWPVGIPPPPDSRSLDTIRTLELDEALLTQLTNPLTGRLAFEDIPHGGITHLFISSNPGITFDGIRQLLDTGILHVLDAGDIGNLVLMAPMYPSAEETRDVQGDGSHSYVRHQLANDTRQMARITKSSIASNAKHLKGFIHRNRSRSTVTSDPQSTSATGNIEENDEISVVPGAERLIFVMREKASKNLTHLRIDHSIATAVLDLHRELKEKEQRVANMSELPGTLSLSAELDATNRQISEAAGSGSYATEMSAGNEVFEMDATPAAPRAELPGDIIHFAISPPIGDVPYNSIEEVASPIRGEGAMAPEVVDAHNEEEELQPEQEEEIVLDATGSGIKRKTTSSSGSGTITQNGSANTEVERPRPLQIRKPASRTQPTYTKEIEKFERNRPKLPAVKLHPSFLPNLRTLLLTNVPPRVAPDSDLVENLKAFIAACASEERLALLKARTDYSLPPGRARQDAERENARALFALTTIVLEIEMEPEAASQRGWNRAQRRVTVSKSSTGDRDSEAMWSAAADDFSFFGAEGEESSECGIYEQEPSKYFPTIPFDEKFAVTSDDYFNGASGTPSTPRVQHHSPSLGNTSPHGSNMTPSTPISRTQFVSSPRNLPLGRNRRTIGEPFPRTPTFASDSALTPRSPTAEGSASMSAPRSQATVAQPVQPPLLDVVTELAKWRKERKAAYEQALLGRARANSGSSNGDFAAARLAEKEIYVEGYWAGEVKVIRNSKQTVKGKLERTGKVDIYGNYFEGGYLYP